MNMQSSAQWRIAQRAASHECSSTAYALQPSFHARTPVQGQRLRSVPNKLVHTADRHLRRHGIQLGSGLELARVRPGFREHRHARAPRCCMQLQRLCEVPNFSALSQVMALCPSFAFFAPRGSRPCLAIALKCGPSLSSKAPGKEPRLALLATRQTESALSLQPCRFGQAGASRSAACRRVELSAHCLSPLVSSGLGAYVTSELSGSLQPKV